MAVGLNGSSVGINYQLYKGGSPIGSALPGTGFSLNFGPQAVAGSYSVVATNPLTTCNNHMASSAVVGVNPAPTAYPVLGGGSYCPGGAGVHVTLSSSNTGVSYRLYNGSTAVGSAMTGLGSGIDFGAQSASGTYSVIATDGVTGCTNHMSGTATVVVNALPAVYPVIGGGSYCAGGTGVHIGMAHSTNGINYLLYYGSVPVGIAVIGAGGPVDLGAQTGAGTYTVIATDATTGCSQNMAGTATVVVNTPVTPFVSISTGVGDTVCAGNTITFTAMPTNGGSPAYQWSVNGSVMGAGNTYSYIPANNDNVMVTMTSTAVCASPTSANNSVTMTVNSNETPSVSIYANPGSIVCQGTNVIYTAVPAYGGSSPAYTWFINGISMGTTATYSYIPANNDQVKCTMVSNYTCRTAPSANSNIVNMEVDNNIAPVVTVTASPGVNIIVNEDVTFTATVANGGPSPSYQWLVNGVAVNGATFSTFSSSTLSNTDVVACQVLSSGGCAGLEGTNSLTMHVRNNVGVSQVTSSGSDIQLIPNPNKGVFTVKGTLGTATNEEVSLEITDILGQVIYTSKVQAHNGDINERIQLNNNVANGMYILNLRSASENKVFHLVIEQ